MFFVAVRNYDWTADSAADADSTTAGAALGTSVRINDYNIIIIGDCSGKSSSHRRRGSNGIGIIVYEVDNLRGGG